MVWEFNGFEQAARYRVEHSWPGKRLIYVTGQPEEGRTLDVRFEADGSGTQVTITDESLPPGQEFDELARGVASGWANALRYLDLYLSSYHGRAKRTAIALASGRFDFEAALQWFEPGLKRDRWLDVPPGDLQPGWRLDRHFVWRWPSIKGTIELNAFQGSAGEPNLALRAVSWAEAPPPGLDKRMRAYMERLSELLIS